MIKVGLTGNRFSGKSVISNLFMQIGIPVFKADVILKFIIGRDLDTISEIKSKVGEHIFKNGKIDPRSVSDIEFEKILDCAKFQLIKAYEAFNKRNTQSIYSVFESSFLFETDFSKEMDLNISVFCPKTQRIERGRYSTGRSVSDVVLLLRDEMDDIDKNKISDFIIHNYENMDILKQVNVIDQKIIDAYLKNEQVMKSTVGFY